MLRLVRILALVVIVGFLGWNEAGAQTRPWLALGGGLTSPIGDYKEYAKTGWVADVALGRKLGGSGNLEAFADVFYGKNNHDDEGDSTTLMGGGLNLMVTSTGSAARVYGYGGLGMQNHKYNTTGAGDGESDTKPYARGALGISLGSGRTTFWVELGIVQGFGGDGGNTAYMPILAGIGITL